MDGVLELISVFVAWGIYGTADKPRHPAWSGAFRIIAFGGVFIAIANTLKVFGGADIPILATVIWLFCSVIVLSGDYYLGSKRVALALGALLVLQLALFIAI